MRTLHVGPLLGWIAAVGLGPSAFAAAERTAFLYRNGEQQGALIHDYANQWAEYVNSVDRFRFIETARSGDTIELLDAGHPAEGNRRSGPAGRRPVRPESGYRHRRRGADGPQPVSRFHPHPRGPRARRGSIREDAVPAADPARRWRRQHREDRDIRPVAMSPWATHVGHRRACGSTQMAQYLDDRRP
jgi:hypothetical protein